jgi:L-seryl-tRNA(Ser) seleniumtransferase
MAQSGATLVEVGTTNKTRLSDYRQAVTEDTRALMKVHTSNYRVVGFTASVQTAELVQLGRELGLPVIEDLGSGVLIDLEKQGLAPEPTAQSVLEAGVDVVTFSGDKLLGGPQAGIILGAEEWIAECRRHPLTRALRVGKLTLAALAETLLVYQRGPDALRELPVYELLLLGPEKLQPRAEELMNRLHSDFADELVIDTVQGHSRVGGGALPLSQLPSVLVSVMVDGISTAELELRLRTKPEVPLIGRVQNDRFLMDMRTVRREEFALVAAAFDVALERGGGAQ